MPGSIHYVLATQSHTKREEYRFITDMLLPGWTSLGYDGPEPVEDGLSFQDNALIKARAAVAHTALTASPPRSRS